MSEVDHTTTATAPHVYAIPERVVRDIRWSTPLLVAALLLVPLWALLQGQPGGAALLGGLELITIVFGILPLAGNAREIELRPDRLVVRRVARATIALAWVDLASLTVHRRINGISLELRTRDRHSHSVWISERWMSNFGDLQRELSARATRA